MTGPKAQPRQTELMKQFKVAPDDPLAPSLLLIDSATRALENAAKRALAAAGTAADTTYQRLVSEVLDRITRSQIQRATTRGVLIGVLAVVIPCMIDHAWLKLDYDQEVDSSVAAELNSTPADVRFALEVFQARPKIKQDLAILEDLENFRPGFAEWANRMALRLLIFSVTTATIIALFPFNSAPALQAAPLKIPSGKCLRPESIESHAARLRRQISDVLPVSAAHPHLSCEAATRKADRLYQMRPQFPQSSRHDDGCA